MGKSIILLFCLFCTACSGLGSNRRDSVWNSYDYRTADGDYGYYQDNDDYYTQPYTNEYEAYRKQQYYNDNDEFYKPPSSFGCSPDAIHLCR